MTTEQIKEIVEAYLAAKRANQIPFYRDWRIIMGLPTFLVALATAWVFFGFPTVASSNDIKRVERSQAETAIVVYQGLINGLIATTPPDNAPPQQREAWREEVEKARRLRDRAVEQKIELLK